MEVSEVANYVVDGEVDAAEEWTLRALEEGVDTLVIVNQGLIPGMEVVGEEFQNMEYLVVMILERAGLKAVHFGLDVSSDEFLEVAEEKGAQVGCLTVLLTTTIDRAKEFEMRNRIQIYVDGAPVTDDFAQEIGADGYAPDAGSMAKMIKAPVGLAANT